jgi:hypothetical protein
MTRVTGFCLRLAAVTVTVDGTGIVSIADGYTSPAPGYAARAPQSGMTHVSFAMKDGVVYKEP